MQQAVQARLVQEVVDAMVGVRPKAAIAASLDRYLKKLDKNRKKEEKRRRKKARKASPDARIS